MRHRLRTAALIAAVADASGAGAPVNLSKLLLTTSNRIVRRVAFGGDGLPRRVLYLVGFGAAHVWGTARAPAGDRLLVDVYEHWLEPA